MRFGMMMAVAGLLAVMTAGMARGEWEVGKLSAAHEHSSSQVMVADATQTQRTSVGKIRRLGVCHLVPMIEDAPPPAGEAGYYVFGLGDDAFVYLENYEHRVVRGGAIAVKVLQKPEHGVLDDAGGGHFAYFPNPGYLGKDKANFEVEYAGEKFQIVYFFRVIEGGTDGMEEKYCPKGQSFWKISSLITTPFFDESQPWRYASMEQSRRLW